jgi:hypothetical protein
MELKTGRLIWVMLLAEIKANTLACKEKNKSSKVLRIPPKEW